MEDAIMLFFWNLRDSAFAAVAGFVSGRAYIAATTVIVIGYVIAAQRRRGISIIAALLVAVSISDLLCYRVLKPAIGRLRPKIALGLVEHPRTVSPKDYSLPSNHAANSFAFFAVFLLLMRRWWPAVLANAFLIAVSRIVLIKHYPSDVLAGVMIGGTIGLLVARGMLLIESRLLHRETP